MNLKPLVIYPYQEYKANVVIDEIGVPITKDDLVLPCGMTGRVEFYD